MLPPRAGLVPGSNHAFFVLHVVNPVRALHVSVAEKSDLRRRVFQDGVGIAAGEHVLVLVARRAMDTLEVFERADRPLGQAAQELHVVLGQALLRPERGAGRHRVEVLQAHQAGAGLVVIAAHKDFAQSACPLAHFVGIGAVADQVAQVEHAVVLRHGLETGFERFQVGMNVRDDQDSHV